MELQKCKSCGKIFPAINKQDLCADCMKEEEKEFRKVKDYLWDHPGCTIKELKEETDVDDKLIRKFVREGRLKRS